MKALFLGDSITEGFNLQKYFPGRGFVNHGISGYSSAEVLDAMHAGWFNKRPDVVFLCIGTNDLARDYDQADTLDNIRRLTEKIKEYAGPDARIFLTSLFPTRHNPPRPNPVIRELNLAIHQMAHELNTDYLHLHPFFRDKNGQLEKSYTNDGLHLNETSYNLWAEIVRPLLG